MKHARGDLWTFHPTHWIVVPTNLGWSKKGLGIMGAGVALQAAERFPHLRDVWGAACRRYAETPETASDRLGGLIGTPGSYTKTHFDTISRTFLFPTKPLDKCKTALSWRLPASIPLIQQSTVEITRLVRALQIDAVALPLVGCGYGGLAREQVLPILEKLDDRFTLVER